MKSTHGASSAPSALTVRRSAPLGGAPRPAPHGAWSARRCGARLLAALISRAAALPLALGAVAGCAKLDRATEPRIETRGGHALSVGASLTIEASTRNGRDDAYVFESEDERVARVDADGRVVGVALGETDIVVTGQSTGATALHAIVVGLRVPGADGGAEAPGAAYYAAWSRSGHADTSAEAFSNWDEDGQVPESCARCHSRGGFLDFLGADGTAPGRVDAPAATGTTVDCDACHAPEANALDRVTFPSGVEISGAAGDARCMTCHQGRSSGDSVAADIAALELESDDAVSEALGFENIHYYPAASTLFAGRTRGGFQYEGRVYDTRFRHVEAFNQCTECHDPHSTRPRFEQCVSCHPGASTLAGARDIRMLSSVGRDYDGDGDTQEGIYYELSGSRERLLEAIQRYGAERAAPLCYAASSYPYWFSDTDGDGECSAAEAVRENAYAQWTARLVRSTYNYQMATKDPGAFAHNAKYILELLYDSVEDLNAGLSVAVDLSASVRGDRGHFDGSSEAARHWDEDEAVQASCSQCHGGQEGFRFYLQYGVSPVVLETANGLECGTCHINFEDTFDIVRPEQVTFPGGTRVELSAADNLCATCHSGRESGLTVDAMIATGNLRFANVHYLPAAGVRLGAEAHVGYEYPGQTYAGDLTHDGGVQCISCHDPVATGHSFLVEDAWDGRCALCHADANGEPRAIRQVHLADYDGDGDTTESLAAEVAGMAAQVLAALQAAAPAPGLCYAGDSYPYFFIDGDSNGQCSAEEATGANRFAAWTPALVRAAFNYQLSQKEPGAWAHNFDYIGQLLFDSAADLAGDGGAMTRP